PGIAWSEDVRAAVQEQVRTVVMRDRVDGARREVGHSCEHKNCVVQVVPANRVRKPSDQGVSTAGEESADGVTRPGWAAVVVDTVDLEGRCRRSNRGTKRRSGVGCLAFVNSSIDNVVSACDRKCCKRK